MEGNNKTDLGRLLSVHGIAPAYLQRAGFIVILSFLFFLTMMFIYYVRQSLVYFLLASAFLVLYLVTMFSWVMQRRNVVSIYENGIEYRGRSAAWADIEKVDNEGTVYLESGNTITLPSTLHESERLIAMIMQSASKTKVSQ